MPALKRNDGKALDSDIEERLYLLQKLEKTEGRIMALEHQVSIAVILNLSIFVHFIYCKCFIPSFLNFTKLFKLIEYIKLFYVLYQNLSNSIPHNFVKFSLFHPMFKIQFVKLKFNTCQMELNMEVQDCKCCFKNSEY